MKNLPIIVKDSTYKIVRISRTKKDVFPVEYDVTCIVTTTRYVLQETKSRAPYGDIFVIRKNDKPIFSGDCTV